MNDADNEITTCEKRAAAAQGERAAHNARRISIGGRCHPGRAHTFRARGVLCVRARVGLYARAQARTSCGKKAKIDP